MDKTKGSAVTVDTTNVALSPVPGIADVASADAALLKPEALAPATEVPASGALMEPTISEGVDTAHPAVDNEPRAHMPKVSNQIDFNDPTLSQEEAVAQNLTA